MIYLLFPFLIVNREGLARDNKLILSIVRRGTTIEEEYET